MTESDIFMTSRPAGSRQAFGNRRGSAVRVAADWLYLAESAPRRKSTGLVAATGRDHAGRFQTTASLAV
jgi:hypothetical protein